MIIYLFFLFIFILFCAGQLRSLIMLLVALKRREVITNESKHYPNVLIQIPVYKEGWEVKNAVLAALAQDYPKEKLAVQIIDDSPDRYPDLVEYLQTESAAAGVEFSYLNRTSRHGYKSGALNYGMQFSEHELITILDADFVLDPSFLKKTVGYFADENIACVQTSWRYRNHFENAITATQATIFETIFVLEQNTRSNLRIPALFTGTSGIWRRSVILEIGGWRETPFTAEDIDLSFRSYTRGYQLAYIDEHLSSCEATSSYIAFKHQQQRWSRGVWQAGIHNLGSVLHARQRTVSKIIEISTIIYNLSPLLILLMGLLSAVHVIAGEMNRPGWPALQIAAIALICLGPTSQSVFYAVSWYHKGLRMQERWKLMGSFLLGVGLAWAMVFGIWQVFMKSKKEFVVTPKGKNTASVENSFKKWMKQSYVIVLLELVSFLIFVLSMILSWNYYRESIVLFVVLASGGLYSFIKSVNDIRRV